jgi:ABC-type Fe3+/spermidine/putrescine transport system ATPase subunit
VLRLHDLHLVRRSGSRCFELRVPSLSLLAGETLAVLGPNGAGKTSLLLALAGLMETEGGEVEGPGASSVTMVFQRPAPFAGSVEHNVRVALAGKGLGRDEVERRVEAEIVRFGLEALRSQAANRLSGGELRRMALARGMVLQPKVLLLDEPFDDLDARAQVALAADLERLAHDTGVALALVTHDLRRATRIARRIAVLEQGSLTQVGAVAEVLESPVSCSVARLVGMANLLPGCVGPPDEEGSSFIEIEGGGGLRASTELAEGSPVWAGVRPERLKLDLGRGPSAPLGTARILALQADSVLTRVELDWHGHTLRTRLLSGRGPSRSLQVGERVDLSLRPQDVHLMPR